MEDREKNAELILQKIDRAENIMNQLTKIAEEDDNISYDEEALLDSIRDNLKEYRTIMENSIDKGKEGVGDDELEQIHILEKKLVQDASSTAFDDGRVTNEERKLLSELIEILENLNKE